jgi:hypothetical protein
MSRIGNAMSAFVQWAHRAVDERHWTVEDARAAAALRFERSSEHTASASHLTAWDNGAGGFVLSDKITGQDYALTNYSFSQLCRRLDCPVDFMTTLRPAQASDIINDRMNAVSGEDGTGQVEVFAYDDAEKHEVRAITSEKYARFADAEMFKLALPFLEKGWRIPPARPNDNDPRSRPATEADVLNFAGHGSLSIRVGDMIAPAGAYSSDRDAFLLLINESNPIQVGEETLFRAVMFGNSEVGKACASISTLLFESVCGNHILWSACGAESWRFKHLGRESEIAAKYTQAVNSVLLAAAASPVGIQDAINRAKAHLLAPSASELESMLYNDRKMGLGRKQVRAAYALAEAYATDHGDPLSAWGIASGLTRLSQTENNTNERLVIDAAAARVLALVPVPDAPPPVVVHED